MKNHFNIKKLTIFTFIFMCFFAISNKVEALSCIYDGIGDTSKIHASGIVNIVLDKNGNSVTAVFKQKQATKKFTSVGYVAVEKPKIGDYYAVYDASESELNFSGDKCPSKIYFYSFPDSTVQMDVISYSYFTSADGKYKKLVNANPDCKTDPGMVGMGCGVVNLLSSEGESGSNNGGSGSSSKGGSSSSSNNKNLICKYSGNDFITSGTSSKNYISIDFNNFAITEKVGNYAGISPVIDIKESAIGSTCPSTIYYDFNDYPPKIVLTTNKKANVWKMSEMTQDKITIDINTSDSGNTIKDRCSKIEGIKKYFTIIFNLLRYAVPAIIIIVSTLEFAGVVLSGEDEKMEKAKKHFIVRLIIGVVILLVPFLLEFVLRMAGMIDTDLSDIVCNIF